MQSRPEVDPAACRCRRCSVTGWVRRHRPRALATVARNNAEHCPNAAHAAVDDAIDALGWDA